MRQTTPFLGIDIGGITDESSMVHNYVTTMLKIDEAIRLASQQGVTELEARVEALEAKLAKTGDPLTVEGLSNGILTAGGYVAVSDPAPQSEER